MIPTLANLVFVLAESVRDQRLRAIRENWAGGGQTLISMRWYVVGVLALMVLLFCFKFWEQYKLHRQSAGPRLAFLKLAHALKLPFTDRQLLTRIARQQDLASPITLMLSRATLEHHAQAYASTLPARRRPTLTAHVQRIATQCFS